MIIIVYSPQEKKQRSTVLNARITKFYELRVQLHGVSLFLKNVPGTFNNATHQVKVVAIALGFGISRAVC